MRPLILSLLSIGSLPILSAELTDIVVYGGTSGGIAAAIQAKRLGKSTVLIEPTKFVGGLTTGGLGATDIGNKGAIGGMSREFYQRIHQYYSKPEHWKQQTREDYFAKRHHGNSANEDTQWTFEPHAASEVYAQMLKEAGVEVIHGERLDLQKGVVKEGAQIVKLVMESGREFTGKTFIDATYEGDVMAKAGVSYHVGRESNATYGETLNGLQIKRAVSHQFKVKVDPYVKPGDPSSGLLPGVWPMPKGNDGDGDKHVQAYNFRMCTTDVSENRRDWPKPANYDPLRYELLLRNCEAGDLRVPWAPSQMPNRKTDTNNNFAISTDNIGMNFDYPEADYATRAKIWADHEDYQKGLMWTLANSPRVPEKMRKEFQRLGLAKDEFTDYDNWPRQLYVREARRMISDYVMTEKNCRRLEVVEDSVGMGAYNMDSHNVHRYVTPEGYARNEGDIQVGSKPYPISYRSIRPKEEQCTNLLVPVCMSASHIAYGSIRMEPVFMVLGQSSASAAALAIDGQCSVQKIDYAKLKAQLVADKQVLDFIPPTRAAAIPALSKEKLGGIVVDDSEAEGEGFDAHGSTTTPYVGEGYRHDGGEGDGMQHLRFTPSLEKAGRYEVKLAYCALGNRASNATVIIKHADGETKLLVNQKQKPKDGLLHPLGTFNFTAGKTGYVELRNTGADGHVIADAVQWKLAKE